MAKMYVHVLYIYVAVFVRKLIGTCTNVTASRVVNPISHSSLLVQMRMLLLLRVIVVLILLMVVKSMSMLTPPSSVPRMPAACVACAESSCGCVHSADSRSIARPCVRHVCQYFSISCIDWYYYCCFFCTPA